MDTLLRWAQAAKAGPAKAGKTARKAPTECIKTQLTRRVGKGGDNKGHKMYRDRCHLVVVVSVKLGKVTDMKLITIVKIATKSGRTVIKISPFSGQ